MSVLRNLAWVRNDLSVTMTDAFASDASVWNARVTCYVVLEKRDRAIKLHKLFGAPRTESCPEDTKSCEHLLKRVLKYGEKVGRLKAWVQLNLKDLQI